MSHQRGGSNDNLRDSDSISSSEFAFFLAAFALGVLFMCYLFLIMTRHCIVSAPGRQRTNMHTQTDPEMSEVSVLIDPDGSIGLAERCRSEC